METEGASEVDRIMAREDVHTLVSRTYDYVALHGKRDFADVIKDPELWTVAWIIQVGSVYAEGSFKCKDT